MRCWCTQSTFPLKALSQTVPFVVTRCNFPSTSNDLHGIARFQTKQPIWDIMSVINYELTNYEPTRAQRHILAPIVVNTIPVWPPIPTLTSIDSTELRLKVRLSSSGQMGELIGTLPGIGLHSSRYGRVSSDTRPQSRIGIKPELLACFWCSWMKARACKSLNLIYNTRI
jgi:hypothetical protein